MTMENIVNWDIPERDVLVAEGRLGPLSVSAWDQLW